MPTIAIDFGTSRIKVAYLGKADGKPKLWHLGQHERPWMPSLVYLGKDGTRLIGDAAEAMLHSDPDGVVSRLKRRLREPRIRVNGQSASPCELLSTLFSNLRCRAGEEIRDFDGKAPSEVFLTVPSLMVQERSLYQKAASDAGFVNAEFVPEPIAAAQAWLAEAQEHDSEVLVLDCGGGTIDWAALRKVNDRFDFMPECPPGGDGHLGGEDVDDSILALIEDAVPSTEFERDLKQWEAQARLAKEHFSNTRQSFVARVAGHSVTLLPDAMSQLANDALVEKASAQFLKYAALARNHLRTKRPLVLLVGGTSKIAGLKERLAREDSLRVVWWEKSEFATVRGALSFPISPNPVQNNEPKHMLEIGLHWLHGIGVPHDSERAVVWIKKGGGCRLSRCSIRYCKTLSRWAWSREKQPESYRVSPKCIWERPCTFTVATRFML
jgi:molecular chaperone DnaK (HSP70)